MPLKTAEAMRKKFCCRFYIAIANDDSFRVARRIIGDLLRRVGVRQPEAREQLERWFRRRRRRNR